MKTTALLPLTAAALFALCAGSMALSHNTPDHDAVAPASSMVDLPTINVRPDPADLAYFQSTQSRRVVDLPAIKVTPDLTDFAYYQASRGAERIVTLAAVTVHPAAADLAWYLSQQTGQVVGIDTSALKVDATIAAGAATLIRAAR